MIELFDTQRLTIHRDHSIALMAGTLLTVVSLMGAYTLWLQLQLNNTVARTQVMQAQASQRPAKPKGLEAPSAKASLVDDLRRQAEQLEREIAAASGGVPDPLDTRQLAPAQWLQQLATLTQTQTSLNKIDVDRRGGALIEGQAQSPQALNSFVQAWEQTETLSHLRLRTLEIKQDKLAAEFLRFALRASPTAGPAANVTGQAPH